MAGEAEVVGIACEAGRIWMVHVSGKVETAGEVGRARKIGRRNGWRGWRGREDTVGWRGRDDSDGRFENSYMDVFGNARSSQKYAGFGVDVRA